MSSIANSSLFVDGKAIARDMAASDGLTEPHMIDGKNGRAGGKGELR